MFYIMHAVYDFQVCAFRYILLICVNTFCHVILVVFCDYACKMHEGQKTLQTFKYDYRYTVAETHEFTLVLQDCCISTSQLK